MGLTSKDISWTVVSAMVGGGIFVAPTLMLQAGASPALILILFTVSGLIALLGALTVSELAAKEPGNGGAYLYLRRALGPGPAFLFNWTRFGVMQTGALAFLSLASVDFLGQAFGWDHPTLEALLAIWLLAITATLNAGGLRLGKNVQAGLTILKLAALISLVIGVLVMSGSTTFVAKSADVPFAGIGSLLLLSVFAMGGWTQVTFLAGELRNPNRLALPMGLSIVGVTALYLVSLIALFLALPAVTDSPILMLDAAQAIWGPSGPRWISLAIAIAVLGGLHTMTLTGPRLYQAAAKQGQWPARFAQENKRGAPHVGLMYQALWAMVLIFFSLFATTAYNALIGSISTAIWVFHVLLALAWFRMRKDSSPFRTPLGPWVAGAFLLGTSAVVAIAVWDDIGRLRSGQFADLRAVYSLLLIGFGAVWYMVSKTGRVKPQQSSQS